MNAPTAGQYVCVVGHGLIAAGIRFITQSPYTHVVCSLGHGDCIEADRDGVHLCRWSKYEHSQVLVSDFDLTLTQRNTICETWREQLGKPYGVLDDVAIGLSALGITWSWVMRRLARPDTIICSQLAALGDRSANVNPWGDKLVARITPRDCADAIEHKPIMPNR